MIFYRFLSVPLLLASLLLPISSYAAKYTLDPGHSFVQFRIQHLGYSWLPGRFNQLSGHFNFDPTEGAEAQNVFVKIDTASIDTNHAERDKHIKNIINVAEFGEATFESTSFNGDAKGGAMKGNLTMHGVTHEVEIQVNPIGAGNDPWGGYRAGFEGTLVLDRKDFDIDYDLGSTGWEVELSLYIEGIRE